MALMQPGSITLMVYVASDNQGAATPYIQQFANDGRIAQVLTQVVNNPRFGFQLPLIQFWWNYGVTPLGDGGYEIAGQQVAYMQGGPSPDYVSRQLNFILTWEGIPTEQVGDNGVNLGTDTAGPQGGFINPFGLYSFYIPGLTELGAAVADAIDLRATIWLLATGVAGVKAVSSSRPLIWGIVGLACYSNYKYKQKIEDNWDCIRSGQNC